jgi:putative spermidine/putrescine transport system substrate-binding protein
MGVDLTTSARNRAGGGTRRGLISAGLTMGVAGGAAAQGPATAPPPILRVLDTTEATTDDLNFDGIIAARPALFQGVAWVDEHLEYLFGDIRLAVEAGQPPFDLVVTSLDGAMIGAELGLWQPVAALVQGLLPPMDDLLTPLARLLRGAVREQAQIIRASTGGPLFAYAPARVPRMPRTAEGLLGWARENPRRLLYPRPEFSEAGRCFVAGLPWLLNDRDPHDPQQGWPKTWDYLAELDRHVAYYPTTSLAANRELAEGGADIVATTVGLDIINRANGVLPLNIGLRALADMHWVPSGTFVAVMRGLPAERLPALARVIADLLEPDAQRNLYGRGRYWPGPVRNGVTLEAAPVDTQSTMRRLVRSWIPRLIADSHFGSPLLLEESLLMLRRWGDDISAWHGARI